MLLKLYPSRGGVLSKGYTHAYTRINTHAAAGYQGSTAWFWTHVAPLETSQNETPIFREGSRKIPKSTRKSHVENTPGGFSFIACICATTGWLVRVQHFRIYRERVPP